MSSHPIDSVDSIPLLESPIHPTSFHFIKSPTPNEHSATSSLLIIEDPDLIPIDDVYQSDAFERLKEKLNELLQEFHSLNPTIISNCPIFQELVFFDSHNFSINFMAGKSTRILCSSILESLWRSWESIIID
jgi:hypothetical protein